MPRIAGATWLGSCYLYVDYTVTSQSVSENFSDVSYTFGIHFGDSYFNSTNRHVQWGAGPGTGFAAWDSAPSLPFPGGMGTFRDFAYYSSWVRIYHDGNGDATASTYATINPSAAGGGGSRSVFGSFALPHILRLNSAPSTPVISNITSTSVLVSFQDGSGGAPVDARYIGWSTSLEAGAVNQTSSGNSATISGLIPGTRYYFWAITHNSAGYSGWSPPATAITLRVPDAPNSVELWDITQVTLNANFGTNGDGGSGVLEWQLGYGTDPTTPQTFRGNWDGAFPLVTGLSPGLKYYFWARGRNAIGWGPWSVVSSTTMIAGARVLVGAVWKTAVPYVKVGGVWKLARPWTRILGVWKETI